MRAKKAVSAAASKANKKFGLTTKEFKILQALSTPAKIQNFLDRLPINFEKDGFTYMSPRRVLRERRAHCLEGALLSAIALWLNGEEPLIMDLKTVDHDDDHVVTLYQRHGRWGAISKTNHASLRFRDPIYRTPRELAASYFHEYFMNDTGEKTLRSYSQPFNLKKLGKNWITAEENLDYVAEKLDKTKHLPLFPKSNLKHLRLADKMERKAGEITEWPKSRRAKTDRRKSPASG